MGRDIFHPAATRGAVVVVAEREAVHIGVASWHLGEPTASCLALKDHSPRDGLEEYHMPVVHLPNRLSYRSIHSRQIFPARNAREEEGRVRVGVACR